MHRRAVLLGGACLSLAACAGQWKVAYEQGLDPNVTRNWRVTSVAATAPESLSVSNANRLAPNAKIVWHGEPFGNRRAQVAQILKEGLEAGVAGMNGPREVTVSATLRHFHSVTPYAVANAPAAVHNILYGIRIFDAKTGEPLTTTHEISADLEAFVGASAMTAAVQGETQRVRIVRHIGSVTRGWLGLGPDRRREFASTGR